MEEDNQLQEFQTYDKLQKKYLGIHFINKGSIGYLIDDKYKLIKFGDKSYPNGKDVCNLSNFKIKEMSSGRHHVALLDMKGRVFCWGGNDSSQYGQQYGVSGFKPLKMLLPIIEHITCGENCTLALRDCNETFFWGTLVFGNTITEPKRVNFPSDVIVESISAGRGHAAALDSKGKVYTWGFNGWGQLGLGHNEVIVKEPTVVEFPKIFKYVLCAKYMTGFVTLDGKFYVSGGSPEQRNTFLPTEIKDCGCIVEIAASWSSNVFAIKNTYDQIFEFKRDAYWLKPILKRTLFRHISKVFIDLWNPSIMPTAYEDIPGIIKKVEWKDMSEDEAEVRQSTTANTYNSTDIDTFIDVSNLYNEELYSDFKIELSEGCIYAHKLILSKKSKYFKNLFENDSLDVEGIDKLFNIREEKEEEAGIISTVLPYNKAYIKYLYTGQLDWQSLEEIPEIFSLAVQESNEKLKNTCFKIWEENLKESNIINLYESAFKFQIKELMDACSYLLNSQLANIIQSEEYNKLSCAVKASLAISATNLKQIPKI